MNTTKNMIIKNYTMHLTMMIMSALVSFVGGTVLGFIFGLLVYALFVMLLYGDGADRGERASTLLATVEKLESENKDVDEQFKKQTFLKKRAVIAFLASSLPFALLAIVNLIFADPGSVSENTLGTITRIVFLPVTWLSRVITDLVGWELDGLWQSASSVYQGLLDYEGGLDISLLPAAMNTTASFATAYNLHYVTILRASFIVLAFIPPAAQMIGYLQGPKLRDKKMKEIAKGTRKKRKKLKVFGNKKSGPRQMKPEV